MQLFWVGHSELDMCAAIQSYLKWGRAIWSALLWILEKEKAVINNPNCSDDTRISGYFCLDTVFNLSWRVLSEDENKVLKLSLQEWTKVGHIKGFSLGKELS